MEARGLRGPPHAHALLWLMGTEFVYDMAAPSSPRVPLSRAYSAPGECEDDQLRWKSTAEMFRVFRRSSSSTVERRTSSSSKDQLCRVLAEQEAGLQRQPIEVLEKRLYLMFTPLDPESSPGTHYFTMDKVF